jgi:hypothetical protein
MEAHLSSNLWQKADTLVARPCKDCRVFKIRPFEHRFRSISFVHHNSTGAVDPPQSHCVVNFSSNFNQRWVADMGLPGPDGPKGKFLLLPPDYKGEVPSGYHVATSKKTRSSAAARCWSNPSPIADPIALCRRTASGNGRCEFGNYLA